MKMRPLYQEGLTIDVYGRIRSARMIELGGTRANVWLATQPAWNNAASGHLNVCSFINTSEGMPKMKIAIVTVTLALGLGLSGASAQNANDRPGMTAPQEGTMS